jgi:hypothetical protein
MSTSEPGQGNDGRDSGEAPRVQGAVGPASSGDVDGASAIPTAQQPLSEKTQNSEDEKSPDLRDVFRKKGGLTLPRLRKRLRSTELRVLSNEELLVVAGEVVQNKQLAKLSTMLLALSSKEEEEALGIELVVLASAVITEATKKPLEVGVPDDGAKSRDGADHLYEYAEEALASLKAGKQRHDLAVLILVVSLRRGQIEPDEVPDFIDRFLTLKRRRRSSELMPEAAIRQALLRNLVKPTDLEAALDMKSAHDMLIEDLRAGQDSLRATGDDLRQVVDEGVRKQEEQQDRIEELLKLEMDLRARIAGLEQDLVSHRNSSKYSLQTTKARLLGMLSGELTRWLQTAQDAATADQPSVRVVIERLEQALRLIEGEIQWLQSSD